MSRINIGSVTDVLPMPINQKSYKIEQRTGVNVELNQ